MIQRLAWKGLTTGAAIAGGIAARKAAAALWPGSTTPPLNPADRRISWREAFGWAILSGAVAGVARLLSRRATAGGWQKVVGETPPGVAPARPAA